MSCYSCGTPSCTCGYNPCTVVSGCPIQLDFSCILYHKNNNDVTELDGLSLANGATLELVIETLDERIKQLAVLDFSLPYLRAGYVINTMRQFCEAVDTEFDSITAGTSSSGTYTPSVTQVTAVTNPTANVHTYTRIGDIVTVYGSMSLTTAIGTDAVVGISLPVVSDFAAVTDLNGVATSSDSTSTAFMGQIKGDSTNDRASLAVTGTANGTFTIYYTFQYIVL